MKTFTSLALASAVLSATAAPVERRAEDNNGGGSSGISDAVILNYALTLEHLEATFYAEALQKFSQQDFSDAGFDSSVYGEVQVLAKDEATHVDFLTAGLKAAGATPVAACTYDFGYSDVKGFLATASVLEGVGVSAYLGAAAFIMDKEYLTAAGSILTVEARHSSYIRNTIGEAPFPSPFDVPLTFNDVYSLAAPFITSCPSSNPSLPVKAFPGLTASLTSDGYVKVTPADSSVLKGISGTIYASFAGYPTSQFGVYDPSTGLVEQPYWQYGQQYVFLTTSKDISDDSVIAGPAILEVSASNSS